jgi:hypothetical protein
LRNRYRSALLQGLLLVLSSSLYAQVDFSAIPEANPARPTVSTPATLTPAGYLQFENGALYAATSPEFSRRLGINQVTKLSVDAGCNFWRSPNHSHTALAPRSRATGRVKFSRACRQ